MTALTVWGQIVYISALDQFHECYSVLGFLVHFWKLCHKNHIWKNYKWHTNTVYIVNILEHWSNIDQRKRVSVWDSDIDPPCQLAVANFNPGNGKSGLIDNAEISKSLSSTSGCNLKENESSNISEYYMRKQTINPHNNNNETEVFVAHVDLQYQQTWSQCVMTAELVECSAESGGRRAPTAGCSPLLRHLRVDQ